MAASLLELECTSAFMLAPSEMKDAAFYFRDEAFAINAAKKDTRGGGEREEAGLSAEFFDDLFHRQERGKAMQDLKARLRRINEGRNVRDYREPHTIAGRLTADLSNAFLNCLSQHATRVSWVPKALPET
jgi:hypothetical protein